MTEPRIGAPVDDMDRDEESDISLTVPTRDEEDEREITDEERERTLKMLKRDPKNAFDE